MDRLPHLWCPGCGHGIVLGALVRALAKLEIKRESTAVISGIGCSSRATGYLNFDTMHTAHGRAIPFATGFKIVKPLSKVIVLSGDGDCTAIGGNHFIHGARRNIDLTVVIFNNQIYGMTGGQYSPETPLGKKATTAPYGMVERNFDIAKLAEGAGATFVARGTVYHAAQLSDLLAMAIAHQGFSVVEVVSQCPTYYGRKNGGGSPAEMMLWQKAHAVSVKEGARLSKEELGDRFITGVIYREDAPEYMACYEALLAEVGGMA